MSWKNQLRKDSLPWLLESNDPGVRYLALRDLLDVGHDDRELKSARKAAHREGPIAEVLTKMNQDGYWVKAGPGYNPKYRSTVWSMILLAQLGASANEDKRIEQACGYLLDHGLSEGGQFTSITSGTPSGTIDCLQGNLLWSLMELGYTDTRIEKAYEWMARTVTGDGMAPMEEKRAPVRYYAYKCGPLFACGVNNRLPCAWGGAKVMLALSKLSAGQQTPLMRKAIRQGVEFFLAIDPVTAKYPTRDGSKPNRAWWKFGFPIFYVSDLLQIAEGLAGLGCGGDPRLSNTLNLIHEKQDKEGRWPLEYDYTGKTWIDFGEKKQPNKWVTLRALRVIKAVN